MAEERVVITIREDGSRVVSRNLRDIGSAADRSKRSVASFNTVMGGLLAGLSLNRIRQWADTWTAATGKVNIFTSSIEHTNVLLGELYKVSQQARQPLDSTVNTFHQMNLAADALGASERDLVDVTSAVNKVFAIQGTTAQTARGGIIQFGQAMSEGIVRAQEYNSMINAMPLLLKVVAKQLPETGGQVSKLRAMMLDGELTSRKFFNALKQGAPEIEALFQRSGRTIGQAFTVLENGIISYIGKLNQSTGISETFFKLANWGAANIEHLGNALLIIGGPLVLGGLTKVVSIMKALVVAAFANPFTAIIAGAIAAVTAVTLYKDEIIILQEEQLTLGDYMSAAWDEAADAARIGMNWVTENVPSAISAVIEAFAGIPVTWDDITSALKTAVNLWIGWLVSLPQVAIRVWEGFPTALANVFKEAFNFAGRVVENNLNTMIGMANSLRTFVGMEPIQLFDFKEMELDASDSFGKIASDVKNIFQENFQFDFIGAGVDQASAAFDRLTEKAKGFRDQRLADAQAQLEAEKNIRELMQEAGEGEDFVGRGGKKKKGPKGEFDNPRTLLNNLRRLLNQIQPLSGAVLEYERAERILNAALKEGLITKEQQIKFLELTENHYRDIIDPIGAMMRELEREQSLVMMTAREREISNDVFRREEELRKQGIFLTKSQSEALTEQLTKIQQMSRVSEELNQIRQETTGQIEQIRIKQQALNLAFNEGDLTAEAYRNRLVALNIEAATLMNQMGEGGALSIFTEGVGQVLNGYTTLASGAAEIIGSTFTQLTDGIANSFANAIVKGEDLKTSLHELSTAILTELLSSLIKLGIQYVVNAAMGQAAGATLTATSVAQAATVAAAWAPAAAMVSLASFGANAAPAMAGLATTNLAAQAFAKLPGFRTGGDFTVGGSGGADSQLVAFRATPGENVSIRTPAQIESESSKDKAPNIVVNLIEDSSRAGQVSSKTNGNVTEVDLVVASIMGDGKVHQAISRKYGLKGQGK